MDRLAESLLKQGKQPKEDKDYHKAFLMLAHLAEIEDYVIGLIDYRVSEIININVKNKDLPF